MPTAGFPGPPSSPLGAPNFNIFASALPIDSWPPGTNVPPNVIVVKFPNRPRLTYFVERMPFDITLENAASVLEWRCLFHTTTTDGRPFQMISLKTGVTAEHPLLQLETPLVGNFPMLRQYALNQQWAREFQSHQMLACLNDPIDSLTSNFRGSLHIAVSSALKAYSQRYRANDDYDDDAPELHELILEPPSPVPQQPPSPDQALEEIADPDFAVSPPLPSSPQQPPLHAGNATAKGPGGAIPKKIANVGHPGTYRPPPNIFYNATPAHPYFFGSSSPTYSEASTLGPFDHDDDEDDESDYDGPHDLSQRGLHEAFLLARRGAAKAYELDKERLERARAKKRAAKSAKRRERRRLEARERRFLRDADRHERAKTAQATADHRHGILAFFRKQEERNRSKTTRVSFANPASVMATPSGNNRATAGKGAK